MDLRGIWRASTSSLRLYHGDTRYHVRSRCCADPTVSQCESRLKDPSGVAQVSRAWAQTLATGLPDCPVAHLVDLL